METPLEIAFHNMTPSEAVEAEIRKRVDKLERIYDRLIGCRVSVEAPHKQHRTGNVYEVHIEMRVPRGPELVVSREPHHAKERYANPDIRTSLRDAFKVAETKLKAYKEQLRGEVKRHDSMFQGQVAQVVAGQDFGFITTKEGAQLYFHRNSLMDGDFDKLKPGEVIHYVEEMGDTGPTASKVWIGPDDRPD
jgi:cold shock CspA family protein/ribosome-associated translation inhibitor RaiA